MIPTYSKENFPKVLAIVDKIAKVGERHQTTADQATLAPTCKNVAYVGISLDKSRV